MFQTILSVSRKLEELLSARNIQSTIQFKIQMSGMLRTVPFLDLSTYQRFIEENGIPLAQDSVVYGPPLLEADNLRELKNLRQSPTDLEDAEDKPFLAAVLNSITIFVEMCRCLGIPPEAVGLDGLSAEDMSRAFSDLFAAAGRSTSIGARHIGLSEATHSSS
jgi:hypothetical protein